MRSPPDNDKPSGRARRLDLGLHQTEVGKMLGVNGCTITNWEENRSNSTLRPIPKIIEFLGYDPTAGHRKTFGESVLQYRKYHGVSQKELAKQIGINPSTLSKLEKEKGRCVLSVLQKLSAFFNAHSPKGEELTQKPRNGP